MRCYRSHTQVIAFNQFCANVQRDCQSVLAMHNVGPPGGCRGNGPLIAGLNIPMAEPSSSGRKSAESCSKHQQPQLETSSEPAEAIITITAASETSTTMSTSV